MYYAQLTNGVCTSVTQTLGTLPESPDLLPLNTYDTSILGKSLVDGEWIAPPNPTDPTQWLIDVGPFFDRFGAAKMAILTSSNATVKAIVSDLQVRKWVDLKRADVAAGIDALIALGVPGVNAALKTSVLTTPVTADENLALRKLYF